MNANTGHNLNDNERRNNPTRDQNVRSSNPDKDKFLFYFTPDNLAVECCCGCSLKTGVQIISIILITSALSNFFTAFKMHSFLELMISGLAFLLYFAAGVCILYSTIKSEFQYAYAGYFIIAIIFIINLIDNIIVLILILLGWYHPFGHLDVTIVAAMMLAALAIILPIHLYLVWILFSYAIHLKHRRYPLINGYIFYKYYDVDSNIESYVEPRQNI